MILKTEHCSLNCVLPTTASQKNPLKASFGENSLRAAAAERADEHYVAATTMGSKQRFANDKNIEEDEEEEEA